MSGKVPSPRKKGPNQSYRRIIIFDKAKISTFLHRKIKKKNRIMVEMVIQGIDFSVFGQAENESAC